METQLKLVIASDLSGYDLKQELFKRLKNKGYDITDYGCDSSQEGEYPFYAKKTAKAVVNGTFDRAIVICGTGQGITMACNKVKGARAALCYTRFTALMAREHNDARILGLGAWLLTADEAELIIETFLFGKYTGLPRHQARIDAMKEIENEN